MAKTVVHLCYDIARGTGETIVFDDFPATRAGGEGNSVSETEKFDDDAAGADAQDDNASVEPEAGPEADEDSE